MELSAWSQIAKYTGLGGIVVAGFFWLLGTISSANVPNARTYSIRRWAMFLGAGMAVLGLGAWRWQGAAKSDSTASPALPFDHVPAVISGMIVDSFSNQGVRGAAIDVTGQGRDTSDDTGSFRIIIHSRDASMEDMRLIVTRDGYEPSNLSVVPPIEGLVIQLRRGSVKAQ